MHIEQKLGEDADWEVVIYFPNETPEREQELAKIFLRTTVKDLKIALERNRGYCGFSDDPLMNIRRVTPLGVLAFIVADAARIESFLHGVKPDMKLVDNTLPDIRNYSRFAEELLREKEEKEDG